MSDGEIVFIILFGIAITSVFLCFGLNILLHNYEVLKSEYDIFRILVIINSGV